MNAALGLRQFYSAIGCLLAQTFCSALITLHWAQLTPKVSDSHFFDSSGGYLLLEVIRLQGKALGHASLEAVLLVGAAWPLLALAHLRLFVDCARASCPSGSSLSRPTLDALGGALLIRGAQAVCALGCTWLGARINLTLFRELDAGLRWQGLALLGIINLLLVLALVFLGVLSDHVQLSGLLPSGERPSWRRRLGLALLDTVSTPSLHGYRLLRLLCNLLLGAGSVLLQRAFGSSLAATVLVPGLVLLSIAAEAWWYHVLTRQVVSDGLRPWLTDTPE